jgi:hypothetical protein
MQVKDLIGLLLIPMAMSIGVLLTCSSKRARDAAFFLLTLGMVLNERLDINFLSREWYRGTTRGFEFSFVDILAISLVVSSILIPRAGEKRCYWPASLGLMLLYFCYCIFSVAISEPKIFGLFELSKMVRGMIAFLAAALFVRSERELRIFILALGCAVALQGLLAIKHRFLLGLERATGSLDHANSLSIYLCMTGPIFVAALNSNLPRYLRVLSVACIMLASVGIVLAVSRAGIPAFALVMFGATLFCMSWRISLQKILTAVAVVVGAGALLFLSWDSLKSRWDGSSLEKELAGNEFENRGQYFVLAKSILREHSLGVGLNNWSWWVSNRYGPKTGARYHNYATIPPALLEAPEIYDVAANFAPPAHNLGLITAGELGWPGLMLFVLLWMRWFQMGLGFLRKRSTEAIHRMGIGFFFAVCGVFLQSLTEWVYRQTAVFLTFNLVLGALASLYYLQRQTTKRQGEQAVTEEERAPAAEPAAAFAGA